MNNDDSTSSKRRRISPTLSAVGVRATQRPPLSCLECTRRKIKCDRSIPCRQCIDRGDDVGCRREEVAVKGELQNTSRSSGRRRTFEDLLRQVDDLSNRVNELERGKAVLKSEEISDPSRPPSPLDVDATRLPGIMEEAALGIGETSRWKDRYPEESRQESESSSRAWYTSRSLEDCITTLPTQSQSRALVGLFDSSAAWITGSIDMSTFLQEQDIFWMQLEAHAYQDDIWLALYLAVLSVSAFFADEDRGMMTIFTVSQLQDIGRTCFDAAIATIFRCDGTIHPSLVLCQAVQTLGPAFHFTSNTKLHRSLTPISTSHARSLNLHLLGKSSVRDIRNGADIGRQVWWNHVEPDWTFLPYNRYCTISPRHFTTAFVPQTPGSPSGYRAVCYRTARILRDLFGDLFLDQDPTYDAVMAASVEIQEIRRDFEREQRGNRSHSGAGHRIQQGLIDMTIAYRDYQCHRLYFVKALTETRYAKSYTACINAAETIQAVSRSQLPRPYLLMWNTAVMVVASGIILALDHILKPSTSGSDTLQEGRRVVNAVTDRLRQLQDQSGIASRGATLIDHLLVLGDQRRLGLVKDLTVTREAVQQLVTSSQSTHIPDDILWQHQSIGLGQTSNRLDGFANSLALGSIGVGSEISNDQTMWTDVPDSGIYTQHDIDFDFARLLGQIMPNAG